MFDVAHVPTADRQRAECTARAAVSAFVVRGSWWWWCGHHTEGASMS
jgi:hypothetical protein